MKTAMQELIDELDLFKNILWKADSKDKSILVIDIIRKAVLKLEKEKEQMLASSISGNKGNSFEQYYNQTYNQEIEKL
jgi:hypothetical protein